VIVWLGRVKDKFVKGPGMAMARDIDALEMRSQLEFVPK